MFLEDERAAERLRAIRVSLSLMVAVIAFASCIVATFCLFSAAEAGPAMASSSLKTSYVDQKILDGATVLLAAFVAASGLAIWLRRIKGRLSEGPRHVR